jgi:2-polyprenyl-3-methyl-5-hydroxy-6-metoxy-1,4-benzoquinol methylase
MANNDAGGASRLRARAGFLHFAKCAGSSVAESLIHAVGGVEPPPQQFDTCYLAGFDEPQLLDPGVAATVAWDDKPALHTPYALHQHWSLPTLRRHFEPADIAVVAREPGTRVLSQVLFTRAMPQAVHRRWRPHTLPAQISAMPLVELLQYPAAARVTDNLMVRQILWGDPRLPPADFVAERDAEALAADAIAAVGQLGCVGVVERLDAAWDALDRWIGVSLQRRFDNRTRDAQCPGLLRRAADIGLAAELLAQRNRADHLLWRTLAEQHGIEHPDALADELVDRKLRRIVGTAFLAHFSVRDDGEPGTLGAAWGVADDDVLVVGPDADGELRPNARTTALSGYHRGGASGYATVIHAQPSADYGDLLAGRDYQHVILGPSCGQIDDLAAQMRRVDHHLAGGYSLLALVHEHDVTNAVLAAAAAGWRLHERSADGEHVRLRFGRAIAPPTDTAQEPVTHYGIPIDLANHTDSRAVVLSAADGYPRVLELGCSEGLITRVMAERGQQVTGVEFDPAAAASAARWAEQIVVADLDADNALDPLGHATFDLIIASDVLEHLRHPADALGRALRHLAPGGRLLVSIPNTAHADVRAALLGGQFPYAPLGLLDRTHIHLFTYDSLLALLRDAGLVVTEWRRTLRPIGDTEVPADRALIGAVRSWLHDDPHAITYQWILTCARANEAAAVPDPMSSALPPVAERIADPASLVPLMGVKTSARALVRSSARAARRRLRRR